MKTTSEFLDALRVKLELPSDGRLADYFGMHRQYMSRYRQNVCTFDDEMSIRVAEILEVKPAFIMACMHYQRAKNPKVKDAWQYLGGLAAALALVAILPFIHLPETGLIPAASAFDNNDYYASGIYIMRISG